MRQQGREKKKKKKNLGMRPNCSPLTGGALPSVLAMDGVLGPLS